MKNIVHFEVNEDGYQIYLNGREYAFFRLDQFSEEVVMDYCRTLTIRKRRAGVKERNENFN